MWLEIFRTGSFTDSKGRTNDYTAAMLEEMVNKFAVAKEDSSYAIPLVKGHPQTDSPAHGWVERLARRGNFIYAKFKGLSQEILDDVRSGRFKRVSIAVYPDLLIKHIGLLGAAQPAVAGLAPAEFDDAGDASIIISYNAKSCLSYSENTNSDDAVLLENLKLKDEIWQLKKREKEQEFREYAANFLDSNPYIHKSDALIRQITEILLKTDIAPTENAEFSENSPLSDELISLFNSFKPANLFASINRNNNNHTENIFAGKQVDERKMNIHNSAVSMLAENPEMTYEQAINQILAS